ncbi:unnamed protein product [Merluccius merluccius]
MDDVELQTMETNSRTGDQDPRPGPETGDQGATHLPPSVQVTVGSANGETPSAPEHRPLLHPQVCEVERLQTALNEKVFWKCTVWMTVLVIIIFIAVVIFISIVLCEVLREDVDDKFDRSSYDIPQDFNGSFRLTNQVLAEELLTASSNQSQVLASQLQKKLSGLYSDSLALGRFFSSAEIYDFRNDSMEAVFSLRFLLPGEDQDRIRKFTLSRELVYNVLRQFLYDQETDPPGPLQIDPASLQID